MVFVFYIFFSPLVYQQCDLHSPLSSYHTIAWAIDIQYTPIGTLCLPLRPVCPNVSLSDGVLSLIHTNTHPTAHKLIPTWFSYTRFIHIFLFVPWCCVSASGTSQQRGHVDSASVGTVANLPSGYSWHPHTGPADQGQRTSAHWCGRTDVHQ